MLNIVVCVGWMSLLTFSISAYRQSLDKASRKKRLMDRDWKFYLGDDKDASTPGFNDSGWRVLNLPHDWSIEGNFSRDAPFLYCRLP